MERLLVLFLLAAACGDKAPRAPDPKQFAAMNEDAKCEATRPRAQPCVGELMAQQVAAVLPDPALAKQIGETPSSSDEDATIHRVNCQASAGYADAVFACWSAPDCKAFATCVVEKDAALTPRAKPPSPP